MSRIRIVRYRTRPEAAEENQRLVEKVFAELSADDPGGLRYATFRLADGVSFVHVVVHEGDDDPLGDSAAFAAFQQGIGDRVTGPPEAEVATLVGSYRFGV
jgi:quinol monooxygenase YgiN